MSSGNISYFLSYSYEIRKWDSWEKSCQFLHKIWYVQQVTRFKEGIRNFFCSEPTANSQQPAQRNWRQKMSEQDGRVAGSSGPLMPAPHYCPHYCRQLPSRLEQFKIFFRKSQSGMNVKKICWIIRLTKYLKNSFHLFYSPFSLSTAASVFCLIWRALWSFLGIVWETMDEHHRISKAQKLLNEKKAIEVGWTVMYIYF